MRLIDSDEFIKDIESYIERKAITEKDAKILEAICELVNNAPTVAKDYDTGYQDGLDDGLNDIRTQGEWKRYDKWVCGEYLGGFYHVDCPEIEKGTALYSRWPTNFCPNCGARMGVTDENG